MFFFPHQPYLLTLGGLKPATVHAWGVGQQFYWNRGLLESWIAISRLHQYMVCMPMSKLWDHAFIKGTIETNVWEQTGMCNTVPESFYILTATLNLSGVHTYTNIPDHWNRQHSAPQYQGVLILWSPPSLPLTTRNQGCRAWSPLDDSHILHLQVDQGSTACTAYIHTGTPGEDLRWHNITRMSTTI